MAWKELIAEALHRASPREGGPFVALNCAALPPNLLESELFGHERGAFTGAEGSRRGRFELAHRGTLFLDEICEMELDIQAKLLRALELGEIHPLGSEATRKVDVRIVAATNRDLEREREEGRFREDLFYRLQGVRLKLPPLEDRSEDVPLLIEHFLRRCADSFEKPGLQLEP